ncbi:Rep family protein, partial [Clostridioides difficile]|uniref:Rep family protein n=1 Tax=Clostridioides difficile TaxID=1496 RepID=UPI000BCC969E
MAKNVKKRNWAFVLYPESSPENWREKRQKQGWKCAISPLHDRDMNPDNTPKKANYHVILTYRGPTSYNVVKALTDGFNQPITQALEQVRGYYRYRTHKDKPEKAKEEGRE